MSNIIVIVGELIISTVLLTLIYLIIKISIKQIKTLSFLHPYRTYIETIQYNIRDVLLLLFSGLMLALLTLNGYLIYNQIDLWHYITEKLAIVPPSYWFWLGIGMLQAFVLVAIAHFSIRHLTIILSHINKKTKSEHTINN